MNRGKEICKTLKDIRRRIAEENDINLDIPECTFKGECRGTCPKCESELRFLASQLRNRRRTGRAVKIAGISAGAFAIFSPGLISAAPESFHKDDLLPVSNAAATDTLESVLMGLVPNSPVNELDSVSTLLKSTEDIQTKATEIHKFRGQVFEGTREGEKTDSEPLYGAFIENMRTKQSVATNSDGWFEINLKIGDKLRISYVGYKSIQVVINDLSQKEFFLFPNKMMMGEVVILTDNEKLGKVSTNILDDGVELKVHNKAGAVINPQQFYVDVVLLDTNSSGKPIKDEDGDIDSIEIEPTSETSETVFISYSDLLKEWFSDDWINIKKDYPRKIVLRIGEGTYVDYKDVKISIPKDAIEAYEKNQKSK